MLAARGCSHLSLVILRRVAFRLCRRGTAVGRKSLTKPFSSTPVSLFISPLSSLTLPSFILLSFLHLNFPSGEHLHSHIAASTYTGECPEEDRDYVEEDSAQLTVGVALQVPAGDFDLVCAELGKYA